MTREELEKMFDEEFGELFHLIDGEDYGWKEAPMADEVRQFIFETIIPEVLKSIIVNKEGKLINIDAIVNIKQKAKELYGIDL